MGREQTKMYRRMPVHVFAIETWTTRMPLSPALHWSLHTPETLAMVTIGSVCTFSEPQNIECRSNPLRNSAVPCSIFDI